MMIFLILASEMSSLPVMGGVSMCFPEDPDELIDWVGESWSEQQLSGESY